MEVVILFVLIVGLLLIGVPIAVALGLSSIIFLLAFSDTSLATVAQSLYQSMAGHYTLLAIPVLHPGLDLHVDGRRGAADHPLCHRLRRATFRAAWRLPGCWPA